MISTILSPGRLLMLGGLGMQPGFRPVWKELLSQPPIPNGTLSILLLAATDRKPVLEQRVSLAEETLGSLGMITQTIGRQSQPSAELSGAAMSFGEDACVFAMADENFASLPSLLQTQPENSAVVPLWNAALDRHRSGMPMIATAGVAAALGEYAFAPVRPYPPVLETLTFDRLPGIGLLPGTAILPYFDRFPEALLDKMQRLFPRATTLVGIDEQAVLVSGADAWQVTGLGNVSILIHNQVALVAESGAGIPGNLLAPYR